MQALTILDLHNTNCTTIHTLPYSPPSTKHFSLQRHSYGVTVIRSHGVSVMTHEAATIKGRP